MHVGPSKLLETFACRHFGNTDPCIAGRCTHMVHVLVSHLCGSHMTCPNASPQTCEVQERVPACSTQKSRSTYILLMMVSIRGGPTQFQKHVLCCVAVFFVAAILGKAWGTVWRGKGRILVREILTRYTAQ